MAKRDYNVDIDVNNNDLLNVDSLALNTSTTDAGGVGKIWWNSDNETANIGLDAAVTLDVGQEHVIRVKNSSGVTAIPKMRAVVFAGATGDTVTVSPAISTATYEPYTIVGITTEEIPADGFGFVTQFGFIPNVDTSTPGWTLGDLLYVNPAVAGGLTNVLPSAPNWKFPVAAVTRVHASTGRILVRTIPGGHLHDIVDVAISSPADNEVLAYDSASGTWINQTAAEAGLSASNSFTTISTPSGTSPVADSSTDTLTLVAGTGITITGDSSADSVTIASTVTDTNTTYDLTSTGTSTASINLVPSSGATDSVTITGGGATTVSHSAGAITISSTDTNTTYGAATSTTLGLIELASDTVQSTAANAVTSTASRTYGIQVNSGGQAVVNVPWVDTDTNTTYTAGTGLLLTGTSFSNTGVTSITGTANQVVASASTGSVTLSLPQSINTTSSPTFTDLTLSGDLALNGGDLTTTSTSLNIGNPSTATSATISIGNFNPPGGGLNRTINIGTVIGAGSSLINIGNINGGTATISSPTFTISSTSIGATSASTSLYSVGVGVTAPTALQRVCLGITSNSPGTSAGANIDVGGRGYFALDGNFVLAVNRITGTASQPVVQFYRNGTAAGTINASTSAAPTFVSPSDYRLKTDIEDFSGGLAMISSLKPKTYRFIEDEENTVVTGFIAHEYAEVFPNFVEGEKDAVDEEGNPVYQTLETTSVIPYLISAIKELKEINDSLTQRLESAGL